MNLIPNTLVHLADALLLPVIGGLLILTAVWLLMLGNLLREGLERAQGRNWLLAGVGGDARPADPGLLLALRELKADRQLASLLIGGRVGPVLGLCGTLVPLSPALRSMASGDLDTLSGELQVAFTSTVVGLLVGVGFHVLHALRRRWYQEDLLALESLLMGQSSR